MHAVPTPPQGSAMNLDRVSDKMEEDPVSDTRPITHYFPLLSPAPLPQPQLPRPQPQQQFFQPTLEQMQYRQFGIQAFGNIDGDYSSQGFGGEWRMQATPKGFGGSGKDEMTSTSTTRELLKKVDQNDGLQEGQKLKIAGSLSMHRTDTDALVWHNEEGYQGHPGALRYTAFDTDWASKGHWTKDNLRAKSAKTEMHALADDPTTAKFGDLMGAVSHANARTGVETVRSFSMPFEEFEQLGPPKETVVHSKFGDISNPKAHKEMARYVHNAREQQKWDTAAKLNLLGLQKHVPDTMQQYLQKFGNDHLQAMTAFHSNVGEGVEKRVNVAKSSQAEPLDPGETLHEMHGRKRALSDARQKR